MRLAEVVTASAAVASTAGRLEKIGHLAALLQRVPPDDIPIVIPFLSGDTRQGRIGIGGAALSALRDVPPADVPSLELREVDEAFDRVAAASGAGSSASRAELLRQLLGRATRGEQDFLVRLLFGELRQGALEGVLADAVARASSVPIAQVRRAAMLAGDLAPVARAALADGAGGLAQFILQPFQPVQPMLAESAADVDEALAMLGDASLEYKLDGARIQVHKVGDEVKVYSRTLREVTHAVPEVVTSARALPAREIVLDGEAIALRPDGSPHPFQITMRRFGRKLDVAALQSELPITPMFFDALYLDGDPLVDEPLARRIAVVDRQVVAANRVPRIATANAAEAAAFAARALATGHEGGMAKALDGAYAAGRRGRACRK